MSTTLIPPPPRPADPEPRLDGPPAADRPPRLVRGVLRVVMGLAWLADALDLLDLHLQTMLSLGVLAIGLALLVTARRAGHGGLIALGLITTFLLIASTAAQTSLGAGDVGEQTVRPLTMAELERSYSLAAGELVLDLRELGLPRGDTPVDIDVGMGQIVVRLPEGVAAQVRASVGMGEVSILGEARGGLGVDAQQHIPGAERGGRLVLDLTTGMGTIEVTR